MDRVTNTTSDPAIAYCLQRISRRFPDFNSEDLAFVEECLADCFEIGRSWDSIPILVQEAKPPLKSLATQRSQQAPELLQKTPEPTQKKAEAGQKTAARTQTSRKRGQKSRRRKRKPARS